MYLFTYLFGTTSSEAGRRPDCSSSYSLFSFLRGLEPHFDTLNIPENSPKKHEKSKPAKKISLNLMQPFYAFNHNIYIFFYLFT